MGQPNYKQITELLSGKQPFIHQHSMRAEREDNLYKVYSYRTIIATYNFDTGEWWIDPTKHSRTTSRQQTLVRIAAGFDGWKQPLELFL